MAKSTVVRTALAGWQELQVRVPAALAWRIWRHATIALLAAGAFAASSLARESDAPSSAESLDEVVALGVPERQRRERPPFSATKPDVISVFRNGTTRVRLIPFETEGDIRFRRGSNARLSSTTLRPPMRIQGDVLSSGGGPGIRDALFELGADIDETDGLPAVIAFGSRTSLVNIDYVRLRDTHRPTIINAANVINPYTRICGRDLEFRDDGQEFSSRFILLGDRLSDCDRAVREREGDLFFSDGVPEKIREELRGIYTPLYNRFARMLGSEPGMTFVIYRPNSPRTGFQFERNWSRSSLLVFNGAGWLQEFSQTQREELWNAFAAEQILRRLGWGVDAFTDSAVNYLLLLAKSERDHATVRSLTAQVPAWISACAIHQRDLPRAQSAPLHMPGYECGLIVQFVYDAVIRARSEGENTVFDMWRDLLTRSFRRGESGVALQAFMTSSVDAQGMVKGLLDGSIDWPWFVEQLAACGVRLNFKPDQAIPVVEVASLTHFHDQK